jgi:signal transduction histidine kinase
MKLALINNSLLLEVADNGRGVPESGLTDLKSIGIVGMKERALALGGEVVISSEPGCGTTITATIPLEVK